MPIDYGDMGSALDKVAAQLKAMDAVSKVDYLALANFQPKTVHVHAYKKTVDGKVIQVDPYTKTIKSNTGEPAKAIKGTYMVPPGNPLGKSGNTADYELNPGDKVFATPSGNIVKVPHEGEPKAFHSTPPGQPVTPFTTYNPKLLSDVKAGKLELIAEHLLPKDEPTTGQKIDTGAVHVDVGGDTQVALGPGDVAYKSPSGTTYITVGGTPAVQYTPDGVPSVVTPVTLPALQKWIDKYGSNHVLGKGSGSAGPQKDNPSSVVPDVVQDGNFVHPVTGAKVALQPGDVLYHHKTSALSWMIMHPEGANHKDGQATFIGKNGKPTKASPIALKSVKNYDAEYTVPGDQPEIPAPSSNLPKEEKQAKDDAQAALDALNPGVAEETAPAGAEPQPSVNIGGTEVPLMPGQVAFQPHAGSGIGIFGPDGKIQSLWSGSDGTQITSGAVNTAAWNSVFKDATPDQILAENNPKKVEAPKPEQKVAPKVKKPSAEPWYEISSSQEAESAYTLTQEHLYGIANIDGIIAAVPNFERDIATLALASKLPGLSPSEKSSYTKMRNRLGLLIRLADFHAAVQAGQVSPELDAELADLDSKFSGKGVSKAFGSYFPLYVQNLYSPLHKKYTQLKFQAGLPQLGFDLYNGTESDYQQFAASQGFQWAGGLDQELGKAWAQLKLKDPSVGNMVSLSQIEDLAHQNVVLANAKVQAVSAMQAAKPAPKEEPASAVTAKAALAAVTKKKEVQLKGLFTHYMGEVQGGEPGDMFHLQKVDSDSWKITYDDGTEQDLTSAEALTLVQNADLEKTDSAVLAYPEASGDASKAFNDKLSSIIKTANPAAVSLYELSSGELNKAIKALDGNYVGKMNASVKQQWLQWHAAGFPTATYALEDLAVQKSTNASVHVAAETNVGSWDNPQGKQAWQILADNIDPQVHALLKNDSPATSYYSMSDAQLEGLIDGVGLKPLMSSAYADTPLKGVPYSQKIQVVKQFWELHHEHLPSQSGALKFNSATGAFKALFEDDSPAQAPAAPEVPAEPALPPTPAGVADGDWALVVAIAKGEKTPELTAALEELMAGQSKEPEKFTPSGVKIAFQKSQVSPEKVITAPPELLKLLVWTGGSSPYLGGIAQSSLTGLKSKKESIQKAIFQALSQDVAVSSQSVKYKDAETGTEMSVPSGGVVYQYKSWSGSKFGVISPQIKSGYWQHTNGEKSAMGGGEVTALLQGHSSYPKVFEAPNPLTYEQAKSEIGADKFDWDMVEQAEGSDFASLNLGYPTSIANEADVAIGLKNSSIPSKIKENLDALPPAVQKLALHSSLNGDNAVLDLIQWKLEKGHYDAVDNDEAPVVFSPGSEIGKAITHGYLSDAQTLVDNVGGYTIDAMAVEVGLSPSDYGSYYKQAQVIIDLVNKKLADAGPAKKKEVGPSQELSLKKTSKSLSGMHSKIVWADQHGNEWMSKGFPNDPNGPARVDAEHFSNVIARVHGFRAPETRVMTLEGKYSYVQQLKPAQGDLTGHTLSSLTDEQLADAMSEHILDWVVSNHDSNPQNIMVDSDGKVFGIDKGQAFRFFPDDKLAYGYLPPSNPAAVFYDQFYAAILNHQITKERADKIALLVMERAQRVQTRNDKRHRELLEQALAQRSSWPSQFPTREKFIDGLMARKASALVDFEKLYSDLYKKAGWSWDIDTSQLGKGKLDDHTHVGISQDLAADVVESGTHGKALFFDSPDLEDSHVLLYTELDTKGKTVLKGDTKLRKDADAVVTAWLKNQLITDSTPTDQQSSSFIPTVASHASLPGNDTIYSALVNAAKTVNTHAEDGQYNGETLAKAENMKTKLSNALAAVKAWEESNPEKVFKGNLGLGMGSSPEPFVTAEQQDAWKKAAEYYLTAFDQVFSSKEQGMKTYKAFPGSYGSPKDQFTVQEYTPSADLDTSGEPKIVGKWEGSDGVLEQWSDGNWIFSSGDSKKKMPVEDAQVFKWGKTPVSLDESKAESDKGGAPPQWVFAGGHSYTQMPDGSWKHFKDGKATGATASQDELANLAQYDPTAKLIDGSDQSDEATITSSTGKTLKVVKRKSSGTKGTYNPDTGITKQISGELTQPYGGYEYDVENEDGSIVVEYRPWSEPGVQKSQQGLLRFSVKNWDGSKDQIEDVMDTIQTMGVDLTPADEESMELFYWRHLYGILQDRSDRTDAKWSKTTKHIMDAWKANPDMDSQTELQMLRDAWAKSLGSDVVAKADFMPKFGHTHMKKAGSGFTAGKPHWLRPDFTIADLKKIYKETLPMHSVGNFNSRIVDIVASGGLYATEERLRLLGSWITGMSSSDDQGKGSAGFLFTRQNYSVGYGGQVYLHPRTALRTSNYAFASDHYGDVDARKNYAFFDMKQATSFSANGSNELMIKHGVSILDDVAVVVFESEKLRSQAIARMKEAGITKLHGLPIEQVFVTGEYNAQQAIQAVWGQALAEEKNGGVSS